MSSVNAADGAADLKSKDANLRLAASQAMLQSGDPKLPNLLRRLLKDKDWEIVLLAAKSLGTHGTPKDMAALANVATESPIIEVRRAAVASMGELDVQLAAAALLKKLQKKTAQAACEGLLQLESQLPKFPAPPQLEGLLKHNSASVRSAAVSLMVAFTREKREATLRSILASEYLGVRACALEQVALHPHANWIGPLRELLAQVDPHELELRLAFKALISSLGKTPATAPAIFTEIISALCDDELPSVAGRAAPLVELAIPAGWAKELDLLTMMVKARRHKDAGVRAGAVRLLSASKGPQALKVALGVFNRERNVRIRLVALESVMSMQTIMSELGMRFSIKQIAEARDPEIREALAVTLGHRALIDETRVTRALVKALEDPEWSVAACAAVSIGMTRSRGGSEQLAKIVRTHEDWRLRGAAVVGLTKSLRQECVPPLIHALRDKEPLVAQTALSYLNSLRPSAPLGLDQGKEWTEWWKLSKMDIVLYDTLKQDEIDAQYAPGAKVETVFSGVDMMLLAGADKNMAAVLERHGVSHRKLEPGQLTTVGLDANGVLLCNIETELSALDLERIHWFVKMGGQLYAYGDALREVTAKLAPTVVAVHSAPTIASGNVSLRPTQAQLELGVFKEHSSPIYHLGGTPLISVLQPERTLTLIESADCSERFGHGILVSKLRLGHGSILSSVTQLQTSAMKSVKRLKKPKERMAFAINHLDSTYAQVRADIKQKYWGSSAKASAKVYDDSLFRLLTYYVRISRIKGNSLTKG